MSMCTLVCVWMGMNVIMNENIIILEKVELQKGISHMRKVRRRNQIRLVGLTCKEERMYRRVHMLGFHIFLDCSIIIFPLEIDKSERLFIALLSWEKAILWLTPTLIHLIIMRMHKKCLSTHTCLFDCILFHHVYNLHIWVWYDDWLFCILALFVVGITVKAMEIDSTGCHKSKSSDIDLIINYNFHCC